MSWNNKEETVIMN